MKNFNKKLVVVIALFVGLNIEISTSIAKVGRMGGFASTEKIKSSREDDNQTFDKLRPWEKTDINKPAYQTPSQDTKEGIGDMEIDYTGSKTYALPPVLESVKDLEIK